MNPARAFAGWDNLRPAGGAGRSIVRGRAPSCARFHDAAIACPVRRSKHDMGALEHARYILKCPQCKATGAAHWWETEGWAHARRPAWGLNVSHSFDRVPGTECCGPRSFYGRPLVCAACGADAETIKIDSAKFFAIERPAMRPVAGTDFKQSR
jgi:hypothetical protein